MSDKLGAEATYTFCRGPRLGGHGHRLRRATTSEREAKRHSPGCPYDFQPTGGGTLGGSLRQGPFPGERL